MWQPVCPFNRKGEDKTEVVSLLMMMLVLMLMMEVEVSIREGEDKTEVISATIAFH